MKEKQFNTKYAIGIYACVIMGLATACDTENDEFTERSADLDRDALADLTPEVDAADEHDGATRVVERAHKETDTDECGFGSYRDPVGVEWITSTDGLADASVTLAPRFEQDHVVEIRFRAVPVPVPVDEPLERFYGEPIPLTGDSRVALPEELVAAIHGGEDLLVFAVIQACEAQAGCRIKTSGELYVEDGRAFLAEEYQSYIREKWKRERPWLFEMGVVTQVVDMKGR